MTTPKISRRTVLRGLGTAVALPWLDAMAPAAARAAGAAGGPLRMAFLYVPNGVNMDDWTPKAEGTGFDLPYILEPLAKCKDDLLVLTGLSQDNAFAKGDGPGDHARALACFLTGAHPVKTDGANIKVGASVDQVAAQKVGRATRLPSLELGIDGGPQSGNCDSGYSCAYSANISWRSESTPAAKEINPRLVFERLFASDDPAETAGAKAKRLRYRQSILDFVAEDARGLKQRLGVTDRRKLDEYLTAVRELEARVAKASRPIKLGPGVTKPAGIPDDLGEHMRLMADMIALAFRGDVTRVTTFMLANEGSNKPHPFLGAPEGHHDLSHHGKDADKLKKIREINRFHIAQLAYLVEKLKATPEGDGNLLDHSLIVYGSGIGDGDRHNHDDLPVLLLGKGGGTIKTGRHVKHPNGTPLNNLYLSLLDRMGAPVDSLGDSKGRLGGLEG